MDPRLILCVDDESGILKSLKRCLAQKGYQSLLAESGQEGLVLLEQKKEEVALIIVDQRMPYMSGIEFLHEVKKNFGPVPAILLSGYADAEAFKSILQEMDILKFMPKPWVNKELIDTIDKILNLE